MATVNGLNISDNVNYILEEATYRSAPERDIITQPISTRPGDKFITSEWRTKVLSLKGRVFSVTNSGLRTFVDNLQKNFSIESAPINIDTDRTFTGTLQKLDIPTQFFQNTMVEYSAEFLLSDPFSYGAITTISGSTISGTLTLSGAITISGSVFAQPLVVIVPSTITGIDAGLSGVYQYTVTYKTTGEYITISGTNSQQIQLGTVMGIDYENFYVTQSGVSIDYSGIFSRWEPGSRLFEITVSSGVHNGFKWIVAYRPRYFE